jgi:hypothetical protein
MLRWLLLCAVLFAIAMAGVKLAAKEIVGTFGAAGGLVTIAAMYGAAVLYERRKRRPRIEIIPPGAD